eukprot:364325-Chlamydomonas_euryale.AAC.6
MTPTRAAPKPHCARNACVHAMQASSHLGRPPSGRAPTHPLAVAEEEAVLVGHCTVPGAGPQHDVVALLALRCGERVSVPRAGRHTRRRQVIDRRRPAEAPRLRRIEASLVAAAAPASHVGGYRERK